MRKSIFDIAALSVNVPDEVMRLLKMSMQEQCLWVNSSRFYTIFKFVDEYCFGDWAKRGHFINVDDFLSALDFKSLQSRAKTDSENLLTLIELIYNFWYLSYDALCDDERGYTLKWSGNYYHLKDVMDDILTQYNHVAHIDEDNESVLVVEDKPEVTAAVEILPEELTGKVIRYNHRSLRGELELKKEILISLGAELEPKRKELKQLNGQLEDNIFFMLNNINIRHNNRSKKDKSKYKEYVAKMTKAQLEKWYDELYQMILLAFLQIDNADRLERVKELKGKIVGGTTNG